MTVAYGARGLIGLLTPQANTTVEPEMAAMTPPGVAVLNARLTSDRPTIRERLVDYFEGYGDALAAFANAPLTAVGYACTGASYFAGTAAEDRLIAEIAERRGIPAATAATAVVDALRVLRAERIALVSPYDEALDAASIAYWTARGFAVVDHRSAFRESEAFDPIHSLGPEAARPGIAAVAEADVDAIVCLGTGMPTLVPIAATPAVAGNPLLSCMLCLSWRLVRAATGEAADRASLETFLHDPAWRLRLAAMRG